MNDDKVMPDETAAPALAKWNRLRSMLLRHAIAQGASTDVKLRNFTAHPSQPHAPEAL